MILCKKNEWIVHMWFIASTTKKLRSRTKLSDMDHQHDVLFSSIRIMCCVYWTIMLWIVCASHLSRVLMIHAVLQKQHLCCQHRSTLQSFTIILCLKFNFKLNLNLLNFRKKSHGSVAMERKKMGREMMNKVTDFSLMRFNLCCRIMNKSISFGWSRVCYYHHIFAVSVLQIHIPLTRNAIEVKSTEQQ